MADALNERGAVDQRGFVQLGGHTAQRGDINNGRIAHALPHVCPHVNVLERALDAHVVARRNAEQLHDCVEQAGARVKHLKNDRAHDNGGNEVRKIGNRLHELSKHVAGQVMHRQCQQQCAGECRNAIRASVFFMMVRNL